MMKTSRSRSSTILPSLELLETRDVPSAMGDVLIFIAPSYLKQANPSASAWTSNLQIDFNTLQHNIQTDGWTPGTVASLSKAMNDYGSAQQTYGFLGQIDSMLDNWLLFGVAGGAFGQEDMFAWAYTWIQLHNLDSIISQDAGVTNAIGNSPFNTPTGTTTLADLAS